MTVDGVPSLIRVGTRRGPATDTERLDADELVEPADTSLLLDHCSATISSNRRSTAATNDLFGMPRASRTDCSPIPPEHLGSAIPPSTESQMPNLESLATTT